MMGEPTCLLRSFCNPTDCSSVAKEVDPIRVLGESISFGRFISESLAWEKWSTFSHNRYVEEAEKYSKPGSVAEKKAYFEAHYKKKAAEKAAALVQEANASANGTLDSETQDGSCNHSSTKIKSNAESNETVTEQLDKDAVNYQVVDDADRNEYKCDIEQSEVGISKVERAENVSQPHVDANLNVENSIQVDNSNQLDNVEVHEKIAVPRETCIPDPDTTCQDILALPVKGREVHSSPKLSTKISAAKLLPERKVTDSASKSKKSVGGLVEKKTLTARSLHMSTKLTSCPGETSNTASVSELNRTKKSHPNLPKISNDHPVASRTSTRASHGLFHHASANPKSEGRRSQRLLNKSVSEGVTANAKVSSFSVECLKSSSITRSNSRPRTISSPFRFRSEERAAKRKEFFQRMEEIKSMEAEKVQQQRRCKEKTEHDHKKLRQSSVSKPKLSEDRFGGLPSPSNQTRKTPELVRKQKSSRVQESRNSWKPPISTNNSKRVTEKINQITRQSFTSPAKKITRENAPPNIQS